MLMTGERRRARLTSIAWTMAWGVDVTLPYQSDPISWSQLQIAGLRSKIFRLLANQQFVRSSFDPPALISRVNRLHR